MTLAIDHSHKSPNHSSREGAQIRMIVLHATVGSGPSALAWLCNPQPGHPEDRVSTHYLIYKTGSIYQLVDDSEAAWHAGKSIWRGLNSIDIMQASIGIELENKNDGHDPYPPLQFNACLQLCQDLIARYPITADFTVRHLDIAIPEGRKTDPAGFPMARFMTTLFQPKAYRSLGLPVYQRPTHAGSLWGYLKTNEVVTIDDLSNGHLADGRGFVDMAGLEAL